MTDRSRREAILQAAKTLFREKGYHSTTIRDIADRSGMLSGSLYAHIKTKEDLLFEITDEVADAFIDGIQRVMVDTGTATDKFRGALSAHIRVVAEHLDAAAVFSHEWRALSEARRDVIQQKRDRYEAIWADVLQEGVDNGEFHSEFLRFSRIVTLSVANWLYQWYRVDGSLAADEVAERLATVLLRGLHL